MQLKEHLSSQTTLQEKLELDHTKLADIGTEHAKAIKAANVDVNIVEINGHIEVMLGEGSFATQFLKQYDGKVNLTLNLRSFR